MKMTNLTALKGLLSAPKKIVIVCHKNPDGDAIGSSLGLYYYLKDQGHDATVIVPNDYPHFLKWLPGTHTVVNYETQTAISETLIAQSDLIFTLDFNALHRTGSMTASLEDSKAIKVMIDHHQQPDDYAKFMYSDVTMSSTCEMVYHFIDQLEDTPEIDAKIATCLYVGIMTDTGSFRFPLTTAKTHRVIANLIEKGAINSDIHNAVFDTNSESKLQLLGCALTNLKVLPEHKTAYISLSQEELDTYNFKKGDTEGFVNYGLSIEGVIFAAIFIESKQDNIIKISLRSKGDFSVNEFSRAHFHGGGHTNAAGGKSDLTLKDTLVSFENLLDTYKDTLNSL
jgi:phosphoesterase RecJ-like protein